jgi:hypothetical protein
MNYSFHPAAAAEHLEQITFYESRQAGLGARYREHFLKIILDVTVRSWPMESPGPFSEAVQLWEIGRPITRTGGA